MTCCPSQLDRNWDRDCVDTDMENTRRPKPPPCSPPDSDFVRKAGPCQTNPPSRNPKPFAAWLDRRNSIRVGARRSCPQCWKMCCRESDARDSSDISEHTLVPGLRHTSVQEGSCGQCSALRAPPQHLRPYFRRCS